MSRISVPSLATGFFRQVFSPIVGGFRTAHKEKENFLVTLFVRPIRSYLRSGWRGEVALLGSLTALGGVTYVAESSFFNRPNGGLTAGVVQVDSQTKSVITGNMLSSLKPDKLVVKFKYNDGKHTSFGVLVGKPRVEAGKRLVMDAECIANPEQAAQILKAQKEAGEEIIQQGKANPSAIDNGDIRKYVATTWQLDISRPHLDSQGRPQFRVETSVKPKDSSLKGITTVDVALLEASWSPMTGTNGWAVVAVESGRFLNAETLSNAFGATTEGKSGYEPVTQQTMTAQVMDFSASHPTTAVSGLVAFMGFSSLFAQKRFGRSK